MNKLIMIGLPAILIVVTIIVVQLYANTSVHTSNQSNQQSSNIITSNQSNQQSSNTVPSTPIPGRHIVVDLNESLAVTSR